MPNLIQNITGNIVEDISTNVTVFKQVESQFGYKEWFKIGSYEVFLLNFKKVIQSENLKKYTNFGLNSNRNKVFNEKEISY